MNATTQTLKFNYHAILAIYKFEMARFKRTLWQSLVTPVITTSLYFVVFGAAIGSRMGELGIGFKDLNTRQSSLEDIFVSLVSERK